MKFKILTASAMALALVSANIGKAKANDSEIFGAVIGAATGGFLGSNIGSGKGQLAATAAGTLIGAMIGSSMAQARDYEPYGTRYQVHYPEPRPVYVAPPPRHRLVVRERVIVKHVYPGANRYGSNKRIKAARRHEREQFRRRLAEACYDHPRRCAQAF